MKHTLWLSLLAAFAIQICAPSPAAAARAEPRLLDWDEIRPTPTRQHSPAWTPFVGAAVAGAGAFTLREERWMWRRVSTGPSLDLVPRRYRFEERVTRGILAGLAGGLLGAGVEFPFENRRADRCPPDEGLGTWR
jgi:hypothetical protein